MLQRPYAHACGSCFAPISSADAAAIRAAHAVAKRDRLQQIARLRKEFETLYEPAAVVSIDDSSDENAVPVVVAAPPEPPQVQFVENGAVCPCGATHELGGDWNWCPTCEAFVGAGLVAKCRCGDAEYGDDGTEQQWLICDACELYSHLACWPDMATAAEDEPFRCHACTPQSPVPAKRDGHDAFLHMPKREQRRALRRAFALVTGQLDWLDVVSNDAAESSSSDESSGALQPNAPTAPQSASTSIAVDLAPPPPPLISSPPLAEPLVTPQDARAVVVAEKKHALDVARAAENGNADVDIHLSADSGECVVVKRESKRARNTRRSAKAWSEDDFTCLF